MYWIIKKSLKFRFLILFLTVIIISFGIINLKNTPVDVFPEFAPPYVEIQTEGPGMSAFEIESLVTVQIEEALSNVPNLDIIRSKSVQGLSSVRLIFKHGSDPLLIRQLTEERLKTIAPNLPIPADTPRLLKPLSSTSRILKIGVESDEYSLMDLSMISYWTIIPQLVQVPGVANVTIWGERLKMFTVLVDPEKLTLHNVSLDEVIETTSKTLNFGLLAYNSSAKTQATGFVDTDDMRLEIHNVLPIITHKELEKIRISDRKNNNNYPLTLGDVAKISYEHQPLIGDAVINGGPGLLLVVEKFPWGNTLEVTRGVEKALEELKPGLQNIKIDSTIFRSATFVETAIKNLTFSLILGILFVIFVILLFLWEWKIALISIIIIPISILFALFILGIMGATINVMVLAGLIIAIGAIVDDSIIDVENIIRRFRQKLKEKTNRTKKEIFNTILTSSYEVRSVILYASIIEVIVLVPIFFLGGLSGSFFNPLANAYILAVLISPVIALTITPALIMILLSNTKTQNKESPFANYLKQKYKNLLERIIHAKKTIYAIAFFLVFLNALLIPFLGSELLPSFKERDFLMHWLTKPGTSLTEMYRITENVGKELIEVDGVNNFAAHIGRAISADEVVGIHFTENWVSVNEDADYDTTVNAIQEIVDGYPGLIRDVQTYLKERIREVLTGTSEAIIVRIYGEDLNILRTIAEEVRVGISKIEGISYLKKELQEDIPQIQIKVNLESAKKYSLKPGDIRRTASYFIKGIEVSDIHRDNKVYEVVVWSVPEARQDIDAIKNLPIDTPYGEKIRLEDVAEVYIAPTPNVIKRENGSRKIDVKVNISGRNLGSVSRDIKSIIETINFPLGYHATLLGEYEEQQRSIRNITIATIFILILMLLILQIAFNSWRLALLAFGMLPLSLSGGVFMIFLASGGVVSLGSLVGFLTIFAIAVRNGILLLKHYQHLEEKENKHFNISLVIQGAMDRFSAIMMTALATGLALTPLIVAGDIPGHEIEYPMAIVILGGLITSTIVTLFILPALYYIFGKKKNE